MKEEHFENSRNLDCCPVLRLDTERTEEMVKSDECGRKEKIGRM